MANWLIYTAVFIGAVNLIYIVVMIGSYIHYERKVKKDNDIG